MSELFAFMDPETSVKIMEDAALKHGLQLVLRRYTKDGGDARVRLVEHDEDPVRLFTDGKFSQAFISIGGPKSHSDLLYLTSDENLETGIEMSGGRSSEKALEILNLRTMFKKTKVQRVYNGIRRAIRKVCNQGVVMGGQWPYPKIYWEKALLNDSREWRRELDEEGVPCTPMVERGSG